MKIKLSELKQIIRKELGEAALDTKVRKHRSEMALPAWDRLGDAKKQASSAERRYGKRVTRAELEDVEAMEAQPKQEPVKPMGVDRGRSADEADIRIFNINDVLDHLFPEGDGVGSIDSLIDYEEKMDAVDDWAEKNRALYYENPREDFSEAEAVSLAREAGAEAVVLHDLS